MVELAINKGIEAKGEKRMANSVFNSEKRFQKNYYA